MADALQDKNVKTFTEECRGLSLEKPMEKQSLLQQKKSFSGPDDFEPSMAVLKRIMKILVENNCMGRTRLSQAANMHYGLLIKYLKWMEKRQYIESVVIEGKAVSKLTPQGRDFASKLFSMYD